MQGIQKRFAGIQALKNVDFTVKPGEIHALVGENGAGKSTLMKILSGAYSADTGRIIIDGEPVMIGSPRRGKELGISIVYQEFELADDLTVAENIFIDKLGKNGFVNWKDLYTRARKVMANLGFNINVKSLVGDLSVAYKQMVEIAKALSRNTKILILDEPTAVLSPTETEKLFNTIRQLKSSGVSKQLNELEMDRIIDRVDHQTMPLHVTYSLTPLGWSLVPVINHIYQWGVDHIDYYAQIIQENVNATQYEQGNRPLQISKESELIDSEKESK